jgi:uncharacterized ferritin-like protein (DUF455 family)
MELPAGSLQAWALALIEERSLSAKLEPPPAPSELAVGVAPLRVSAPGRAPRLQVLTRAEKAPRPGALVQPEARARLLHTFAHHEVQAAELFAWALLAFPETEDEFRLGLVSLIGDELRHARMYCDQLERLGSHYGDFPVRDWFWQRFVSCRTPLQFLALMGLGVEAGNLDHAELWAARFDEVGDEEGARCQRQVGREEVAHVRFAAGWFRRWAGELSFERWREELPPPLTPMVMRGKELNAPARLAAGVDEDFLEEYEAWSAASSGS